MTRVLVPGLILLCLLLAWRFPHTMLNPGELVSAHQDQDHKCLECHDLFRGLPNERCLRCHEPAGIGLDSNLLRRGEPQVLFHQELQTLSCVSCHSDHQGRVPEHSLSRFDHAMLPGSVVNDCVRCHATPGDSLHAQLTPDCRKCHRFEGWKNSVRFDHALIAPVSRERCESCHRKPTDDLHATFDNACGACHTVSAWRPSTFDHSRYFILDADHNARCAVCHPGPGYAAYTCYGCHEHSEARIRSKHLEEGIRDFRDCVRCHRSADENEGEGEHGRRGAGEHGGGGEGDED